MRGITHSVLIACLALAVPGQALAGELFSDDFELGTLVPTDNPAGRWTAKATSGVGQSALATGASAHRGNFGFEAADTNATASSGQLSKITADFTPGVGFFHLRMWFRTSALASAGSSNFLLLPSPIIGKSIADYELRFPGGEVVLSGTVISGAPYTFDFTGVDLVAGEWHLFDLYLHGIGTATGRRMLWIDGVLRADRGSLDYTGWTVSSFIIGQPYSELSTFNGTFEFDDVRIASVTPQANRFEVNPPVSSVLQGSCVPLRVTMESPDGIPTPPPYPLVATLLSTGLPGAFFGESTCTAAPITVVAMGVGDAGVTLYFKSNFAPGIVNLEVSNQDFLTGSAVIQLADAGPPDAGPPDAGMAGTQTDGGSLGGPRHLDVGCGCAEMPGPAMALVALGLLWARRRARLAAQRGLGARI
jgi:hypothetical protein